MVSRIEKKDIYYRDSQGFLHNLLALKILYDENCTSSFTKLLRRTGFRGPYVWLIYIVGGSTFETPGVFIAADPFDWQYICNKYQLNISHDELIDLHQMLITTWDSINAGSEINYNDL